MILLTGSTGCLGRELLGRLLVQQVGPITVIVRPSPGGIEPATKIRQTIEEIFPGRDVRPFIENVRIVCGDLELPQYGLGQSEFNRLAAETTEVFHCAASTHLSLPVEEARSINVQGTATTLELARTAQQFGNQVRMHHISTAYVAGGRTGVQQPDELRLDIPFRNSYEQSKAEAEYLVRAAQSEFHIDIFRPSIIVGDSVTGQISAFNVIYIPAKLIAKGLFRRFPAVPAVPFDLVPMDYVADGILELSAAHGDSGSCYHLCTGVGRESTVWEIIVKIIETFNTYRPFGKSNLTMPQLMTAELLHLAQNSLMVAVSSVKSLEKKLGERINLLRQVLPFIPYMAANPQFDNSLTDKALSRSVGAAPLFDAYGERLFRYCLETNWGRLPWRNPSNFLSWYERPSVRAHA